MKSKDISLIKISASGNKFLIADYRNIEWKDSFSQHLISSNKTFTDFLNLEKKNKEDREIFFNELKQNLEEDSFPDGFILIKPSSQFEFSCTFYNKDGSEAEMCGNATCALILYAKETALCKEEAFQFQFQKETINVIKNKKGYLSVSFDNFSEIKQNLNLSFEGEEIEYSFIMSGVPHAVVEWKKHWDREYIKSIAQALRYNKSLQKEGVNVSFFKVKKQDILEGISFERGVEDFTLACGTGAISMALVFHKKNPDLSRSIVEVQMPGGNLLVQVENPVCLFSSSKFGY